MGPNECNISDFTFRLINPDGSYGEEVKIDDFDHLTCFLNENLNNTYTYYYTISKFISEPIMLTGILEVPCKKMSRKKFKKWLMHFPWCNRNSAEAWCYLIGITKGRISYRTTYQDVAFAIQFEKPNAVLFNSFTRQLKETKK